VQPRIIVPRTLTNSIISANANMSEKHRPFSHCMDWNVSSPFLQLTCPGSALAYSLWVKLWGGMDSAPCKDCRTTNNIWGKHSWAGKMSLKVVYHCFHVFTQIQTILNNKTKNKKQTNKQTNKQKNKGLTKLRQLRFAPFDFPSSLHILS